MTLLAFISRVVSSNVLYQQRMVAVHVTSKHPHCSAIEFVTVWVRATNAITFRGVRVWHTSFLPLFFLSMWPWGIFFKPRFSLTSSDNYPARFRSLLSCLSLSSWCQWILFDSLVLCSFLSVQAGKPESFWHCTSRFTTHRSPHANGEENVSEPLFGPSTTPGASPLNRAVTTTGAHVRCLKRI